MPTAVFYVVTAFLAVTGLACLIRGIWLRLATVSDPNRYVLVVLSGDCAPLLLQSAVTVLDEETRFFAGIVAVCDKLNEDARRACELIAAGDRRVKLIENDEFSNSLGG